MIFFDGHNRYATISSEGDLCKTSQKLLFGESVYCKRKKRKKSMIVSEATIKANALSEFFKNVGKAPAEGGKKIVKIIKINHGRGLEIQ